MRIPITPHGIPQLIGSTILLGGLAAVAACVFWPAVIVPLVLWIWCVSFFRDPERTIPDDPNALLSPADGTISDVTRLDHCPHLGGPAMRIGIFLSIFNVHINRAPTAGTITAVRPMPGKCHDARSPKAITENASTTILLDPEDSRLIGPLGVKQVTGLLARHIVCRTKPGDQLATGQRYGMIKYGSRTELLLPADNDLDIPVRPGQKVKAGQTVLARIR